MAGADESSRWTDALLDRMRELGDPVADIPVAAVLERGGVDAVRAIMRSLVRVDQPVVNGDGLVGKVTTVTPGAAQITLITDQDSGVSARVLTPVVTDTGNGITGIVQSAVGRPQDLLLEFKDGLLGPSDVLHHKLRNTH